jgi:ribosome maturation factor RimP
MELEERLSSLVAPTLAAMGYELVRVVLQGRQRPTLQVMAERLDGKAMAVEDCATISRSLSALLDVEDPIPGGYTLEVSSPGIDRPLTRPKDYERFAGFDARLETVRPIDGRKRFRGKVLGLDGENRVRMAAEDGEVAIPLAEVRSAKLVLTDQLIAASLDERHQ